MTTEQRSKSVALEVPPEATAGGVLFAKIFDDRTIYAVVNSEDYEEQVLEQLKNVWLLFRRKDGEKTQD